MQLAPPLFSPGTFRSSATISPDSWHGMTVQWLEGGTILAAPLSDGVMATIKEIKGAIGYIEYGYAKLTKTDWALLQNKAGAYGHNGTIDSRRHGYIPLPASVVAKIKAASGQIQ